METCLSHEQEKIIKSEDYLAQQCSCGQILLFLSFKSLRVTQTL